MQSVLLMTKLTSRLVFKKSPHQPVSIRSKIICITPTRQYHESPTLTTPTVANYNVLDHPKHGLPETHPVSLFPVLVFGRSNLEWLFLVFTSQQPLDAVSFLYIIILLCLFSPRCSGLTTALFDAHLLLCCSRLLLLWWQGSYLPQTVGKKCWWSHVQSPYSRRQTSRFSCCRRKFRSCPHRPDGGNHSTSVCKCSCG